MEGTQVREFNDIASFALHFATLNIAVQRNAENAMDRALQIIEDTAKDKLGRYQPAVGGFPAWPQLADRTLQHHAQMGMGDTPLLLTGGLYASIEHERRGNEGVVGTKEQVGAYQEFGTEKIPPRPFMGPAAFSNQAKIEKLMGRALVSGLMGGNALIGHDMTE
jgi:HK97 gp10 family phage protein